MLSESEIHLRLSIWRPASLDSTYLHGSNEGVDRSGFSPLDLSNVLEQIYVWDAGPHDILGTSMPQIGERIGSELLERFASEYPPSKRKISHFQQVLEQLLRDPDLQSNTYWSDCWETVTIGNGETLNLRANIILTVLRHFLWVARVFGQVPKASVLIR